MAEPLIGKPMTTAQLRARVLRQLAAGTNGKVVDAPTSMYPPVTVERRATEPGE